MFKIKNLNVALLLILAVGAILRLYDLGNISFTNDELSAIRRLNFNSFSALIQGGIWVDGHPGGIQILLYYWTRLVGFSEFSIRLPFVIAGLLAIYYTYKLGQYWFNSTTGLFAAASIAFIEHSLYFSEIARPYSSGLFLTMALTFYASKLFFNTSSIELTKKIKYTLLLILVGGGCLYNHYFTFAYFYLLMGVALFYKRKNAILFLIISITTSLIFIPHIAITLNHLTYRGVGLWLGVPDRHWFYNYLHEIFNRSWGTFYFVVGIITITAYTCRKSFTWSKFHTLSVILFATPMVAAFVYSIIINPILQPSVLLFTLPFFYFILFSYFPEKPTWFIHIILGVYSTILICTTVFTHKHYQTMHNGSFKQTATQLIQWRAQYPNTRITFVSNINHIDYLNFYLEKNKTKIPVHPVFITNNAELKILKTILDTCQSELFCFSVLRLCAEDVYELIKTKYPYCVQHIKYTPIGSIGLYSKVKLKDSACAENFIAIKSETFEKYPKDRHIIYSSKNKNHIYQYDSVEQWGPFVEVDLSNITLTEMDEIKSTVRFKLPPNGNASLINDFLDDEGKTIYADGMDLNSYASDTNWHTMSNVSIIPSYASNAAKIKTYIWNFKGGKLLFDDLSLKIIER